MKKIEALLLGIIAAFGALIVIAILPIFFSLFSSSESLSFPEISPYLPFFVLVAVVLEEAVKFIFINKKLFPENITGISLSSAAFFGLGFSLAEAALILFGNSLENGVYRGILQIAVIHVATSVIMAYILTLESEKKNLKKYVALLGAIAIHLVYNFATLQDMNLLASALSILLLAFVIWALSKGVRHNNSLA